MNFFSAMDKARKGFRVKSRITGNEVYSLDGCHLYCDGKPYLSEMMDILSEWDIVIPSAELVTYFPIFNTHSKVQNEQIGNFI